jgi:hypothetical protein
MSSQTQKEKLELHGRQSESRIKRCGISPHLIGGGIIDVNHMVPWCCSVQEGVPVNILSTKITSVFFSSFLLDVNYSFVCVEAGCQGRIPVSWGGGAFTQTELYKQLETKNLYLP